MSYNKITIEQFIALKEREKELLKTTVGHHLKQLFPENVAFNIAAFLVESTKEKHARLSYESLYRLAVKGEPSGKRIKFLQYRKNLNFGLFFVYSYGVEVIQMNWKEKTVKRLGKWTPTTSRHMNYAITFLNEEFNFKEIA